MSGWFKAPTADWPVIAEMIAKPWPLEAVRMDLAYLADRSKMVGEPMPGRPALSKRWGWTDKKTRLFLEQIKIESRGANEGPAQGPTKGQRRGQRETVETEEFEEKGPTKGQHRGQRRASVGASPNTYIQTTDIQTTDIKEKVNQKEKILPEEGPDFRDMQNPNQAPLSEKAGTSNALLKTSPRNSPADSEKNGFEEGFSSFSSLQGQAEPGGLTPLPPVSRSNCSETHDKALEDVDPYKDTENESGWRNAHQDEKERHTGQLLQLIKTPPEEKREPKLATDFEKRGLKVPLESIATMEVWREHRKYHVKSHETPGKGIFDIVKSAYRQMSGDHDDRVADLVLLVEAANCCPYKPFSYDIRGQGWEDRGGFDRSGDLDTIFRHKKMPARLQSAKEWEEAGKPEEISAPNRRVGHEKFNLEGKFDSDPKWSKPIPGMEGVTMPGFDDEEFWAKYGPILGAT